MIDPDLHIRAKLTVLEFFIEIVMAQHFAQASRQDQDEAFRRIIHLMKTASWTRGDAKGPEGDELLTLGLAAMEQATGLLEKIAVRADQIRRARA
jgi:hypothetical protein